MLKGYSLTTANDNSKQPGRNPKDWTISGCNDYDTSTNTGSWQEICSVKDDDVLQDVNYTKYDFTVDNIKMYQYYKFEITATKGASFMQLSEMGFTYDYCEHDWEKTETAANCTEPAYLISVCKLCGTKEVTKTASALGHIYDQSGICPRCNQTFPAIIGETYYTDIHTAVDKAADNATIKLLCNVSIENAINISKNLTLDLNGFTVTQTAEESVITISSGKTFTLTDSSTAKTGTITGGKAYRGGGVFMGRNCTFNMTGGTIYDCSATS